MNWDYISGFFDADGSITLIKVYRNQNRSVNITFTNNEKDLLESIKLFIHEQTNAKGHIVTKKAIKATHQVGYELRYQFQAALTVANHLKSIHPKKVHRIAVANEIDKVINRNGKYSPQELEYRRFLEEKFLTH